MQHRSFFAFCLLFAIISGLHNLISFIIFQPTITWGLDDASVASKIGTIGSIINFGGLIMCGLLCIYNVLYYKECLTYKVLDRFKITIAIFVIAVLSFILSFIAIILFSTISDHMIRFENAYPATVGLTCTNIIMSVIYILCSIILFRYNRHITFISTSYTQQI